MPDQPIQLPRHLVNQILHLAQLSPDHPIAGLVGAKDGQPHSCEPIAIPGNVYPPATEALGPALAALAARNETLFAIFHSHPATPAEPAPDDPNYPSLPATLRLIISLNTKGVLELRAFRPGAPRTAQEIELLLTE
jgi:[CysO sulfur-carrier protein]-S-L-cysteine hydrolase